MKYLCELFSYYQFNILFVNIIFLWLIVVGRIPAFQLGVQVRFPAEQKF